MPLETGTYTSDLVSTNPAAGDGMSQGDDHIRLIKAVLLATFPNITGAVTATHTELNQLDAGVIGVPAGTLGAATLSIYNLTDTNTGIYFSAADTLNLVTGGTARVTVANALATIGVATTIGGALTVSSGGAAITGNSSITGTFGVSSDFAVNTNKFTVAGASGNTAVAGTLGVTGAATFSTTLTVSASGIIIPDGSAATPAIRQTGGASDCGMYFIADDQIGFATSGTLRTSITATALTTTGEINAATAAGAMIASQAEMETGSAVDKLVTPGRQHFHQSGAKAWGKFAGATGTVAVSYNITSVVRDSAGDYTVTIANDFSSADYVVVLSALDSNVNKEYCLRVRTQAAGSFTINAVEFDAGGFPDADPPAIFFACYGDI